MYHADQAQAHRRAAAADLVLVVVVRLCQLAEAPDQQRLVRLHGLAAAGLHRVGHCAEAAQERAKGQVGLRPVHDLVGDAVEQVEHLLALVGSTRGAAAKVVEHHLVVAHERERADQHICQCLHLELHMLTCGDGTFSKFIVADSNATHEEPPDKATARCTLYNARLRACALHRHC